MARNDFLDNLRRAEDALTPPKREGQTSAEALDWAIWNKRLWLSPKSVDGFSPKDFRELSGDTKQALDRAVEDFLLIAKASAVEPTREEISKARAHFETIRRVVREAVLSEWIEALRKLMAHASDWAKEQDWDTKTVRKTLKEGLLGSYEVPQLLIHTLDGKLLIDPIARFVVDADGLVDLSVMPSFDSLPIFLKSGRWYAMPLDPAGSAKPLTKTSFLQAAKHMFAIANEPA
jgi:hypothetical protein